MQSDNIFIFMQNSSYFYVLVTSQTTDFQSAHEENGGFYEYEIRTF